MRWVVGDIQGCARQLEALLKATGFERGRDELWAIGDLINRGPESLETMRIWQDVGGKGVIGNHEVYALLAHSGTWPRKRDKDTLDELYAAADAEALLASLRALPALTYLPGESVGVRDVWLVHAGLHPSWTDLHALAAELESAPHDDVWLQRPEVRYATRVRCCTPDGTMDPFYGRPEDRPAGTQPWDHYYRGDTLVVHGHWAWRRHYRGPRSIGLDDACVHGGTLTAWCQEEDRIVQVPGLGA